VESLRAAGVDVEVGVLAAEAARGNEVWLTATRLGRPHVTWKYAASLDGRVAAADGSSRWISGAESRADAHRLRAEADAVVVGSGTVLADDPYLTVRGVPQRKPPLRVVVDTNAKTPPGARALDDAAPTLVAVAVDADAPHLPHVVRLPRSARGLDLHALLAALHAREVRGVLLEGGPTLAASFLAEHLVDRVVGYVAPVLVGGTGVPALAGPGAPTLAAAPRLRLDDVERFGPDVRLTARFLEE
jgi:diaminohydroxyphosphoribosylaminopyrimidine deaminase/5-amino-6-(5-phosphoribosylamino)uracil reductase